MKNEDFDQRLECASPKHWSKYKTEIQPWSSLCWHWGFWNFRSWLTNRNSPTKLSNLILSTLPLVFMLDIKLNVVKVVLFIQPFAVVYSSLLLSLLCTFLCFNFFLISICLSVCLFIFLSLFFNICRHGRLRQFSILTAHRTTTKTSSCLTKKIFSS